MKQRENWHFSGPEHIYFNECSLQRLLNKYQLQGTDRFVLRYSLNFISFILERILLISWNLFTDNIFFSENNRLIQSLFFYVFYLCAAPPICDGFLVHWYFVSCKNSGTFSFIYRLSTYWYEVLPTSGGAKKVEETKFSVNNYWRAWCQDEHRLGRVS